MQVPMETEEGIRRPGSDITGGLGARDRAQLLSRAASALSAEPSLQPHIPLWFLLLKFRIIAAGPLVDCVPHSVCWRHGCTRRSLNCQSFPPSEL